MLRDAGPIPATSTIFMKIRKLFILVIAYCLLVNLLMGCATVPKKEALPTYNIRGITYIPLLSLCDLRGINFDYDIFTRTVTLRKDGHKINLMVGDTLVLMDGKPTHLRHPVDIYQGTVVVPYKFKEEVLDILSDVPLSRIKKIVIDAGHGGNDPGAIGRTGLREKDVTLDIAKKLSSLLRSAGFEVVMTRSTDKFVSLADRVRITNNSAADIFLSIHANANRLRGLNGFEVYYVSPAVDDSQRALYTAKNAVLDLDSRSLDHPSLNLKAILWDMIYTHSRAESIELGRSICEAINRNLDTKILGVKGAHFQVLKGVYIPAVLIEAGFLSNYDEERMLKNSYYRQKITEAIAQGIKNYVRDFVLAEAPR